MSQSVKLLSVDGLFYRWIKPAEESRLISSFLAVVRPRQGKYRVVQHTAEGKHFAFQGAITAKQAEINAIAQADRGNKTRRLTALERAIVRRVGAFETGSGASNVSQQRSTQQ